MGCFFSHVPYLVANQNELKVPHGALKRMWASQSVTMCTVLGHPNVLATYIQEVMECILYKEHLPVGDHFLPISLQDNK